MLAIQRAYQHTGDPDDLAVVVQVCRTLIGRVPLGPARAMYLHGLGNALVDRYHLTDDPTDLDEAIAAHEQALAGTPGDSPERSSYLDDWATAVLTTSCMVSGGRSLTCSGPVRSRGSAGR